MQERFAVVFRDGSREAAGALEVEHGRLSLRGRAGSDDLALQIPLSDLSRVRIGRRPDERLNGYRTLVLERATQPAIYVAPLGLVPLPELADLLASLSERREEDVLAVSLPLKPGCMERARTLLEEGPPLDPGSLGLSGHEVYLRESEAVFVFRGKNVRSLAAKTFQHPAVWQAGLAWRRCFDGPPELIQPHALQLDADPDYRWTPPLDPSA